jgi:hypothetical protein
LINLKTKAMRSGAWFKALQRIDRMLFDLTRIVNNIRSSQLAKRILALIRKLEKWGERWLFKKFSRNRFASRAKIIFTAQKLGNLSNTS